MFHYGYFYSFYYSLTIYEKESTPATKKIMPLSLFLAVPECLYQESKLF